MNDFTWEQYGDEAMEFAIYEDSDYPIAALFEEMGELTGKFAKAIRGDKELDVEGARREVGDILWMCAAIHSEHGKGDPLALPVENEDAFNAAAGIPEHRLALGLFESVVHGNFEAFFTSLHIIARRLDTTLEECASNNLLKLADRKARDVLQGSGDNR